MAESGKIKEYRHALQALAAPASAPQDGATERRRNLEGKAAKLGAEIHGEERAAKPRALSHDTAVDSAAPARATKTTDLKSDPVRRKR